MAVNSRTVGNAADFMRSDGDVATLKTLLHAAKPWPSPKAESEAARKDRWDLVTMIYAVRHGLSAADILGRTRGNYAWLGFYVTFVAAVAIHAPIGLRTILGETFGWRGTLADLAVLMLGVVLALWGWRAAYAVFA